MSGRLHLDMATVRAQIDALFVACPEMAEDEALRNDMVEGETEAHVVAEKVLTRLLDAEAMDDALAARLDALAVRRARKKAEAKALRALLKSLLETAALPKLVLPEATLSITKGKQSVEVLDVAELPQGFFANERRPLKSEILAALVGGNEVPGARLLPGAPALTVRTK